jgi:molecular chaperone HtpG
MPEGSLKIHTENILPIIKKWLYSDKDIFLRELVSNACDALQKIRILRERQEVGTQEGELEIRIDVDAKNRTLTIADTGIGMTAEEVETYIAQVAFSGAEAFLSKYAEGSEKDQIIGHFGLGFYSAYMVADDVEIQTLSYKEHSAPVFWSCNGSSSYTIDTGTRSVRGTAITLSIGKENDEYLEEHRLREILRRYCAFLPFPIYLNGSRINEQEPLWVKPPSECADRDYLDFYRALYPLEPDPIYWIHLNVDYPFHLKGILYFPKIQRRFDWSQSAIKLFCNRVFVSDNVKDLIPDYLMILRGALDSPDIPLNVSRSALQMDRTVRQLSAHIAKKAADRLLATYQTDREKFLASWSDIEVVVKLGVLQDDKFYEKVKECLVWKNLSGSWITLDEYLAKHPSKVFYTADEKHASQLLSLYQDKGIDVLVASSPVDAALMSRLEDKLAPVRFQRIDGALDASILDASREKTLLDADGKTESARIAAFFRAHLGKDNVDVEAKSLASDAVPALVVLDEELRRMRDHMALAGPSVPFHLAEKRTLVVNTNNKLIASIYALKDKEPALAAELVDQIYDLSLLSQKEMEPAALATFAARSSRLLERLVTT